MSLFWDVGDDMREVCPPDVLDKVARWQMCKPVSVPFPDKWKENVIEVKVATSAGTYGSYGTIPVNRPWDNVADKCGPQQSSIGGWPQKKCWKTRWKRALILGT